MQTIDNKILKEGYVGKRYFKLRAYTYGDDINN